MTSPPGTALEYNWTVQQGTLVILTIPVLDNLGNPVTVTNWLVDAKIKALRDSTAVLYTFTGSNAVASGTSVQLTVPAADSLLWQFCDAHYRVKLTHPTNSTIVYRILQGILHVSSD